MDAEKSAKEFWSDGYVVIENFFEDEQMDKFNSLILGHYGLTPEWTHTEEFLKRSQTEVIPWFPYNDNERSFDVLGRNPKFSRLTDQILGDGWNELYCMAMFSKQGTKGQAWHQDCPPENPRQFNLNRLVYTHSITPSIGGATIVYPGSHKLGVLPAGIPDQDLAEQIVIYPSKGTVVFLHGHTWHRVLPVTGTCRVSTNFRAIPKDTPENITDVAVYRNMRYRFSTNEIIEERL